MGHIQSRKIPVFTSVLLLTGLRQDWNLTRKASLPLAPDPARRDRAFAAVQVSPLIGSKLAGISGQESYTVGIIFCVIPNSNIRLMAAFPSY